MENNGGCVIFVIWLLSIAISIGSGIVAWDWIEPESFLGALVFLVVWGVLFKVIYLVVSGIVMMLIEN